MIILISDLYLKKNILDIYNNDLYDRNSDFNISIPRYQTVYGNNNTVNIDFCADENIIIFGHLYGNGNCSDNYFVYLACGGYNSSKTGKVFKICGNYDLDCKFTNGLHLDINIPSNIWTKLSILYL